MPNYKFFEVKHTTPADHEKIVFKEFNLATANIKRVRANSHENEEEDNSNKKNVFHAQPMPDFNKVKPKTSVKKDHLSTTKAEPFQLTSDVRGQDKREKLLQQIEAEKKAQLERTKFKARDFNIQEFTQRAASLSGAGSGKTTPSSALMAVVKEFKLHSLMRSQQRDEFDKKLKEKHTEAELAEI